MGRGAPEYLPSLQILPGRFEFAYMPAATQALLMVPLSEEDTFFSLCTLVEDMMPPDYYSAEHDILGARVDQLVFASVLLKELPRLASHLLELQCRLLVLLQPLFNQRRV